MVQKRSQLRNLISLAKPASKSLKVLAAALQKHLNQTLNAELYKRNQQAGEALSMYLALLQKMTKHCKSEKIMDGAIRHKFVCRMSNGNIRKRY